MKQGSSLYKVFNNRKKIPDERTLISSCKLVILILNAIHNIITDLKLCLSSSQAMN